MNTDEQFKQLKKLLALKRYEQPPPGYFDRLPREIISAIEREQARLEPWLRRVWRTLQRKPEFAGAFGLALCALVIVGIFVANKTNQTSGSKMVATTSNASPNISATSQLARIDFSSTNPVLPSSQAPPFLFDSSLLRSSGVPVSVPASPR